MAQHHVVEFGCEPRERRPRFDKWVGLGVEPVEVVGDPHRVEGAVDRGQDVLGLFDNDRLEIAPAVANARR